MNWLGPIELRKRGVLGMNRRNISYISRYNDRRNFPLVDNKLKTKRLAQNAGLMVPELLHIVQTHHEVELIAQTLETLTEFVIKPAQGSGGKGIMVIHGPSESGYRKSSGESVSLPEIKRHLSNIISGLHSLGGRSDVAIIESLVRVSAPFEDISHEGVPDIRLIVFKGYPVMGMLRLATKASDGKANLHQGAVGVGLDIGTGRAIAAVQYNRILRNHPDSGVDLGDIVIPNWQALLLLAAKSYEAAQLGYLGCDIIIDDRRGPMLLELNARPGLSIQIANSEGLLPRLKIIESLDTGAKTVDDRVELVMQLFDRTSTREQTEIWEAS